MGFILAPRLNALGRLDRAIRGVELLLTDRDDEALGLARVCEEFNRERQEMDKRILDEAMRRVERLDLDSTYGIVLADQSWHAGVIGIVASRVVEQTSRPAFLIALQDGVGKGSGRSIPAFDLHSALAACGDLLVKHGGHRAAAGLTVNAARVDEFAERFNQVALARLKPDDLVRELRVDLDLPLAEATDDLEKLLRHMEPFGIGNPGPLFVARSVTVATNATKIGANGEKYSVDAPQGPIEAVGWGLSDRSGGGIAGGFDRRYRVQTREKRIPRKIDAAAGAGRFSMRIIAGEWRGRQIAAPKGDSVRPTLDRVREAWMSMVHTSLPDERVLDLFAGSGALGLRRCRAGPSMWILWRTIHGPSAYCRRMSRRSVRPTGARCIGKMRCGFG